MSAASASRAEGRLLVVNNADFKRDGERLLVAPPTGRFLEELARLGGSVRVASGAVRYGGADTRSEFDLTGRTGLEVASREAPLGGAARLLYYARILPWVLAEVRAARLVYAFLPGHLPLLFVGACRLLGRPYGLFLRGELGPRRLAFVLGGARFVLTTSEPLREAAARTGRPAERAAPMLEISESDLAGERPPRRPGPWRLLFVGRVEEAKGVPELLDALANLRARGLEVELDLVGWALELERHRAAARERGLDAVRFHGAVSDRERIRELYADADVFVMPSRSEGFPRVLYEAMAWQVPIVTTFVGGVGALMRHESNCLEAPRRDAAGLAAALERLLRDPALRGRVAAGGSDTVRGVLAPGRPSHAQQLLQRVIEAQSGS